jgi:hypothetical protein
MNETRRTFVTAAFARTLVVATGACAGLGAPLFAQRSIKPPPPPQPADTHPPSGSDADVPGVRAAKRAQLQRNAEEFREGVERLYGLTGELREEVQKTGTTDVLSVRTYKKAEQIEKLAKQLKDKAKGG